MAATLLALDAGTTGVTAVLFDLELRPLVRAYREFEQLYPRPGWVEHEARAILDAVDATLSEVLESEQADDVRALGITNQRETVFAKDPAIDESVVPGIVWQDRRTAERCAELKEQGKLDLVRRRTGLLLDPYFSATKIEWMLRNVPDLRERADGGGVVFTTVDALIVDHLTEQSVCATDPTNASRTMLYDIDAGRWDPELCELFGVRPDWLPEVRPSVGDFGKTSPYLVGREIPILGVAGDQQAALFGQGCWSSGEMKCTYGTGCFLVLNTGERRADSEKGLLTTVGVGRDGGACYALEGSVFMGGALVQWLRDGLGLLDAASESEELAASVPDAGGVTLVPAFTGLGAPYWDPDARGALLGLTRGTTRAHVARAALEAVALQIAELVELMREETGLPVESMRADGGASANDLLMQLQADLAGVRVERRAEVEATSRGAAALAGLGAGVLSDPEAAAGAGEEARAFEPTIGAEERAERLSAWRAAVSRVLTR